MVAVGSLAGISLFSVYVGIHLARGIICNYIYLTPYALPLVYVLGFFLGYAIPHIRASKPPRVEELFEDGERVVVEAALQGLTQADVAKKLGKVRAHRIIRELENRGIVEREPRGNTFILKPGKKLAKILGRGQ
mgnify:CR=1 FL=1